MRFGVLGTQRVAVWPGTAPEAFEHRGIAPLFDVPLDGHYGEGLPTGIRLVDHEPPPELARVIVAKLLRATAALHDQALVHGKIDERRVVIGHLGQVVLFGRGRRRGSPGHDVIACIALLPASAEITMPGASAAATAEMMEEQLPKNGVAQLAAWVQRVAPPEHVDEVVPDLGAEHDATGLLDRYGDQTGALTVDDPVDEDSSTQINVGQTLWRTLAAPPLHVPPPERFERCEGEPSLAIAQLLRATRPQLVPLPAVGPIDNFVIDADVAGDPDYESSNTVNGPLMEVAAMEAAAKRLRDAPTDPTGVDVPSSPKTAPPPPRTQPATEPAPSPVRVVAVVIMVAIAAAAVAVLLFR